MDFKEVVFKRRSVRKYKSTPISDEDLKDIIEAGLYAPSGVNLQPWYFIAVRSEEGINKLRSIGKSVAAGFEPVLRKRFEKYPQVAEETLDFISRFGGAPVILLAFLRQNDYGLGDDISAYIQSVAAGIENICLMATDKGIGSCWMTAVLSGGNDEKIREMFAPDKGKLIAVVTLGYADQEPKAPARKEGRWELA